MLELRSYSDMYFQEVKKITKIAGAATGVRTWQLSVRIPESYRYINLHSKGILLLLVTKSVILRIKRILNQNLLLNIVVDFAVQ